MSRKYKASPRRRLTAANLLIAHVALHIIFVFGYWFTLAANLSFGELNSVENYAAALSNALSIHLGLLCLLLVHASAVFAKKWWVRRQHRGEDSQVDSQLSHLTAEEKLELVLDEVAELREALHERSAADHAGRTDMSLGRLREQSEDDREARIYVEEYQAEREARQTV